MDSSINRKIISQCDAAVISSVKIGVTDMVVSTKLRITLEGTTNITGLRSITPEKTQDGHFSTSPDKSQFLVVPHLRWYGF
jgi:hypothetical protein